MLNYSFSTVLMTVLTSTVLICIIAVCFHSKRILLSIGYKLIGVFLLLTLFRFIFPFEMPFTQNIILPKRLSMIVASIRHPFFTIGNLKISVSLLMGCIWICGSVYTILKMIRQRKAFHAGVVRFGKDVTEKEPYASVLSKVCDSHKVNLRIMLVTGLDTPQQYGLFRPSVLIPAELELTDKELYYTVCHEFSHYKRHDFLVKLGMDILLAIYWWNPLCHVLSRQIDVVLELNVDKKLVNSDPKVRTEYVETLIHIIDNLTVVHSTNDRPAYLVAPRAVTDFDSLLTRVHFLYGDNKVSKPICITMFGIVTALFLFSYSFIFEAHYVLHDGEIEYPEIQDTEMYATLAEDGTYDIYWGDEFIEHVDSLEYYPGVPVIDIH